MWRIRQQNHILLWQNAGYGIGLKGGTQKQEELCIIIQTLLASTNEWCIQQKCTQRTNASCGMEGSNSRVAAKYGPNKLQVPSANNLISVVHFIAGAYGWNSRMLAPIQEIWLQFLADRTNGPAYSTVLRLSVVICNVCIVAKRCILEQ